MGEWKYIWTQRKRCQYPLAEGWIGHSARLGAMAKRKILVPPLPGTEPQLSILQLIALLNELYKLWNFSLQKFNSPCKYTWEALLGQHYQGLFSSNCNRQLTWSNWILFCRWSTGSPLVLRFSMVVSCICLCIRALHCCFTLAIIQSFSFSSSCERSQNSYSFLFI